MRCGLRCRLARSLRPGGTRRSRSRRRGCPERARRRLRRAAPRGSRRPRGRRRVRRARGRRPTCRRDTLPSRRSRRPSGCRAGPAASAAPSSGRSAGRRRPIGRPSALGARSSRRRRPGHDLAPEGPRGSARCRRDRPPMSTKSSDSSSSQPRVDRGRRQNAMRQRIGFHPPIIFFPQRTSASNLSWQRPAVRPRDGITVPGATRSYNRRPSNGRPVSKPRGR